MSSKKNKIVDFDKKETDFNQTYFLDSKTMQTYNFYIIANNCEKKYHISFTHQDNTKLNINFYIVVCNHGHVKISLANNIQNNKNNTLSQNITGIILDNNSTIDVEPNMNVSTNLVNAEHSVNIGYLNKDYIFYLTSKGISEDLAKELLISNIFGFKSNSITKYIK